LHIFNRLFFCVYSKGELKLKLIDSCLNVSELEEITEIKWLIFQINKKLTIDFHKVEVVM